MTACTKATTDVCFHFKTKQVDDHANIKTQNETLTVQMTLTDAIPTPSADEKVDAAIANIADEVTACKFDIPQLILWKMTRSRRPVLI